MFGDLQDDDMQQSAEEVPPEAYHRPHRAWRPSGPDGVQTTGLRAVPPNESAQDTTTPEGIAQQQQQAPAGPPAPINPFGGLFGTDAQGNTTIFGMPVLQAALIGAVVYFVFFYKK